MAINAIRGGKSLEVLGLKELQAKVQDFILWANPAQQGLVDRAVGSIKHSVNMAADLLEDKVTDNAKRVRVPHEVMDDIFSYKKQPAHLPKAEISSLVGVAKRGRGTGVGGIQTSRPDSPRRWRAHGYVEWHASTSWHKVPGAYLKPRIRKLYQRQMAGKGGFRNQGTLIGENLGTMWELGTSNRTATPFFRPAITESQSWLTFLIKSGLEQGINKIVTGGGFKP